MIQRRVIVVRVFDASDTGKDIEQRIAEKIPDGWYPVEVSASCGMSGSDDYTTAQELVTVIIEKPMSMVQYEEELRELEIYQRAFARISALSKYLPKSLDSLMETVKETEKAIEETEDA